MIGLLYIQTIKCLIFIFIKGLGKLISSPVTNAARGEFETSVSVWWLYFQFFETERLNFHLERRKKEFFFSLSAIQASLTLFHNTSEKFRFTTLALVPEPGHVGLFCSVPAGRREEIDALPCYQGINHCRDSDSLRLKIVYYLTKFCPDLFDRVDRCVGMITW